MLTDGGARGGSSFEGDGGRGKNEKRKHASVLIAEEEPADVMRNAGARIGKGVDRSYGRITRTSLDEDADCERSYYTMRFSDDNSRRTEDVHVERLELEESTIGEEGHKTIVLKASDGLYDFVAEVFLMSQKPAFLEGSFAHEKMRFDAVTGIYYQSTLRPLGKRASGT
jgi:hypothetical protein